MSGYDTVRDKLETGDIILFSGKGGISAGIKSEWSHVGMALRLPEWDMMLLWESTTLSNIKDIEDGTAKRGVQLVALSDRIKTYKGKAAVRHLSVERNDQMKQNLLNFRAKVKNRAYEQDKIELIKAAYDGLFGENTEDLFCSELVAEAYQQMGLLHEPPQGKQSNEYTPKDFSVAHKELKLQKGATLGEEIIIS